METSKPLLKDAEAEDVDVHLYRSMIGSLMYLTALRPDIILISWKCKKQTIVANSTTKAEYVAAASCCAQVLWIQNQMLDYGYNFMNAKIFIDNESTICIVKNLVFHSKTKHIEIRHHFIRDSNEKKLIQMIKIHTDQNVADFLTKAFDVTEYAQMMLETAADDAIQVSTVGLTYYKQRATKDFIKIWLLTSHIRYALTENPTINVSLIQQFWQTATASTLDNGEMEITATIDGKIKILTEASQGEGSTVPVESHHTPTGAPSTLQLQISPTLRSFIKQETKVPQPSSPPHTNVADEAASTRVDVRHEGAATMVTSSDAGQG
ncbi:hypothetical protein Tco_1187681, partial [Tanacetum coccineum]